jgi:hypothetical protein
MLYDVLDSGSGKYVWTPICQRQIKSYTDFIIGGFRIPAQHHSRPLLMLPALQTLAILRLPEKMSRHA